MQRFLSNNGKGYFLLKIYFEFFKIIKNVENYAKIEKNRAELTALSYFSTKGYPHF